MPEKFQGGAETCPEPQVLSVISSPQQVRGKAVTKVMTANLFRKNNFLHRRLDRFLQADLDDLKTTDNAILFIRQ